MKIPPHATIERNGMKTIEIENCEICPFHEFDYVWIEHDCDLIEEGYEYDFETLPKNCPLKKESVHIKLKGTE